MPNSAGTEDGRRGRGRPCFTALLNLKRSLARKGQLFRAKLACMANARGPKVSYQIETCLTIPAKLFFMRLMTRASSLKLSWVGFKKRKKLALLPSACLFSVVSSPAFYGGWGIEGGLALGAVGGRGGGRPAAAEGEEKQM